MDTRVCRDAPGHPYPVYAFDSEKWESCTIKFYLVRPPEMHDRRGSMTLGLRPWELKTNNHVR